MSRKSDSAGGHGGRSVIERIGISGRDLILEPCAKRVRVYLGGELVADSVRTCLLHERGHLPVYYFPWDDIHTQLLSESDHSTHCPRKGRARYWSVRARDLVAENALWNYPEPIDGCPDISGLAAFYWNRMDAWFEEDEQVFVHPRDPHTRIDVLESSRHVQIRVGGQLIAESRRPVLLFETGLPASYYLPKPDVHMDLLLPSATVTACPYKGRTSMYWTVEAGGVRIEDAAWCYQYPLPEVAKIAGRICFYDEKVELRVM